MSSPDGQSVNWPERKVTYKQKLLPQFENFAPETLDSKHISALMSLNTISGLSSDDKAKILTLLVPDAANIPDLSADVRGKLTTWQLEQFALEFKLPNGDVMPEFVYEPPQVALHEEPESAIDDVHDLDEIAEAA